MGLYDRMKDTVREMTRKGQERRYGMENDAGGIFFENNSVGLEGILENTAGGEGEVYTRKIGKKEVQKANETLRRYKSEKVNLEKKIVANEEWWKMRYWEMENKETADSASGWLFNTIISKHADAMDAYPEPNMLPREKDDEEEAKNLSEIVPVILAQNRMRKTYSSVQWYKLIQGTGVYGVFWDKNKLNGLGDITVKKCDLLSLYWDMSVSDIQDSENFFSLKLVGNRELEKTYPQLKGKMKKHTNTMTKYIYEDRVDTSDKSVVVDWYYKRQVEGKTILHFVKFVGEEVLYATENDPKLAERGLYDHGLYPFVYDPLFPINDKPIGFGYVDVCKKAQKQIDLMNKAILKNTLVNATPRFFIRSDGSVNEEEYADWENPFVHVDGNMGEDSIRPIDTQTISGNYITILNNKIEEMKETSGNRDVANGGTTSGVTAASGIAALQEQSGKTSRDSTESSYECYEQLISIIIELIRQFYDVPRKFRITGQMGEQEYKSYSNAGLKARPIEGVIGVEDAYRLPVFDIEINAQKENPYNKISQNELALQMYDKGFFNPQMSDQALACVQIMDFNHKEDVEQLIRNNGTMYEKLMQMSSQMQMMAEIIDQMKGTNLSGAFNPGLEQRMPYGGGKVNLEPDKENSIVENARERAQAAHSPR